MAMAMKLGEFKKLSDDELEKEYDKVAEHTVAGLNYFWSEILRREQYRQTKWLILLTIFMLIATVISAIGVFAR